MIVFGTKQVHAEKYRRDHDMIQGGRITAVVYEEKKHAYGTKEQGSFFREIKTNTNPDPIWITLEVIPCRNREHVNGNFWRTGTGRHVLA